MAGLRRGLWHAATARRRRGPARPVRLRAVPGPGPATLRAPSPASPPLPGLQVDDFSFLNISFVPLNNTDGALERLKLENVRQDEFFQELSP